MLLAEWRVAAQTCSILASFTYSAHALMSEMRVSLRSVELPGNGSLPRLPRNFTVSGATAISLNSFSSRSRIGFGVPLGMCTDHQAITFELVMPCSDAL